jgi:hypothetical protein
MSRTDTTRSIKKSLFGKLLAGVIALVTFGSAGAAVAAEYIDYWGDDLFLGLAYHRFGCHDDDNVTLSNQEYDGFTTKNYCFAGQAWDAPANAGYAFLGWNFTSGAAQLDSCGTHTNQVYGTPDYAGRSVTCSYNIFTNCNSDCWIREFSRCQGAQLGIFSPCF